MAKICCGSSYSVALTANGEVYSWGKGNFGRLGHGSSEDQTTPILLKFFKGHRIVDIACGSGDAQTLAVTDSGEFVWYEDNAIKSRDVTKEQFEKLHIQANINSIFLKESFANETPVIFPFNVEHVEEYLFEWIDKVLKGKLYADIHSEIAF